MEVGDDKHLQRKKASRITSAAFAGHWESVPESMRERLREVLPKEVERCVQYDLKKDPSRYVESTLRICLAMGKECKICFLPTPRHVKMDTETVAQAFVPYSERIDARRKAIDRKAFNEWVWSRVLQMEKISKKMRKKGFSFHHEITTDGVAVSLLFFQTILSREDRHLRWEM